MVLPISEIEEITVSHCNLHKISTIGDLLCSSGVKNICEKLECHWLVDLIASHELTSPVLKGLVASRLGDLTT